jgi:hypothetical protein
MTTALILNIALSIVVLAGVVGMLARSILIQQNDRLVTGVVRLSRRRRQASARARFVGTAVQDRA